MFLLLHLYIFIQLHILYIQASAVGMFFFTTYNKCFSKIPPKLIQQTLTQRVISQETEVEDDLEEKAKLISQVLELQNTLEDLSSRVDNVKEENLRLRSENQVRTPDWPVTMVTFPYPSNNPPKMANLWFKLNYISELRLILA